MIVFYSSPLVIRSVINTPDQRTENQLEALKYTRRQTAEEVRAWRFQQVHLKDLEKMIRELIEARGRGERVVVVVHRRALARTISEAWGIPVYLDDPDEDITGSCVVCIDSIGRIGGGAIDLLVTDESEQVIQHLFRGPLRRQRRTGEIWSAWRDVASRSRKLIFQDARLGELTQTVARKLVGWKVSSEHDEMFLLNTWQTPPPDAHLWEDETAWFENLCLALQDENPERSDWVATLSKDHAEKLDAMIKARFPVHHLPSILITSKTSKHKDVRGCFQQPQLFAKYRLVITSPSCGTGVSVEDAGRWHVWLHARSGCGPNALDALQMLHRVRAPVGSWQIWVGGSAKAGPIDPYACERAAREKSAVTMARMGSLGTTFDIEKNPNGSPKLNPHNPDLVWTDALVEALNNEWGGNLGDTKILDAQGNEVGTREGSLIRALRELGCSMLTIFAQSTDPKLVKEEAAKAKLALAEAELDAIEAAEEKSLEVAELEASAEDASPEADAVLQRASHVDFFYGGEPTPVLDRERLRRDLKKGYRGQIVQHIQLHWRRTGQWDTVVIQDHSDLVQNLLTIDLRHSATRTELIDEVLALFGLTDLDHAARTQMVIQDPGPQAFSRELLARLARDLQINWTPKKSTPMRLLTSILKRIGCATTATPARVGGKVVQQHRLRQDLLTQVEEDSDNYRRRNGRSAVREFPQGEFDLAA